MRIHHSVIFSNVIARVIACGILLALPSGCKIPGYRGAAPAPDLPPVFNGAISPDVFPPPMLNGAAGPEVIPMPSITGPNGPEVLPPPTPNGAAGPQPLPPPAVIDANNLESSAQLGIGEFFND